MEGGENGVEKSRRLAETSPASAERRDDAETLMTGVVSSPSAAARATGTLMQRSAAVGDARKLPDSRVAGATCLAMPTEAAGQSSAVRTHGTMNLEDVVSLVEKIQASIVGEIKGSLAAMKQKQEEMSEDISTLKMSVGASSSQTEEVLGAPKTVIPQEKTTEYEDKLIRRMVSRSRAFVPLLQLLTNMTVLSFIDAFPELVSWMAADLQACLVKVRKNIQGVSGLSVILFAVEPRDDKILFRMSSGPVWTFVMRCVFMRMIIAGRGKEYHTDNNAKEPLWMESFGDAAKTLSILNTRLQEFHVLKPMPFESSGHRADPNPLKRRRVESNAPEEGSKVHFLQTVLIRKLRRSVCRHMTYCRHNIRMLLYKKFLFIVDLIKLRGGTALGKDAGYFVEFTDPRPAELEPDSGGTLLRKWNLDRNDVPLHESEVRTADARNMKLLQNLQEEFPSLSINLHWRRRVTHGDDDGNRHEPEYFDANLSWPARETLSLHQVAGGMLLEIVRVRSLPSVMRASPYAIMAMHVLAVGLRGLLREALGLPLTHTESVAKGTVYALHRKKNDNFQTALLPLGAMTDMAESEDSSPSPSSANESARTGSSEGEATRLAEIKEERLTISWNAYVAEKRSAESSVIEPVAQEGPDDLHSGCAADDHGVDPDMDVLATSLSKMPDAFINYPVE